MMYKRQILVNAIMSMIQIITNGAILFVLYRFLLKTLGIEMLGIWSLVLATTSLTQIAGFGFSGGVVKFVAKYVARRDNKNVASVIQTAMLSIGVVGGFIIIVFYPIIKLVLSFIVPKEAIHLVYSILPASMISLWIMMLYGISSSGLDGYQRIDIRSLVIMLSALLNLFLCFAVVPKYGLIGLAYINVVQNLFILVITWILLRQQNLYIPLIPHKWEITIFKEIIRYSVSFQIMSVIGMFYEPITKSLISIFGGLSVLGYYEMANKMVQQFRAIIVSANQVLVPHVANIQETMLQKIESVYFASYKVLFYLALPLYTFIIVGLPYLSEVWIGHYESSFVYFGILLSVGYFFNTINAPSYFINLGTGELKWNLISHFVIATLNILLGSMLGMLFHGIGVVIGWVVSLALGSSIVYLQFHFKNKIPFGALLPRESIKLMLACFSFVILLYTVIFKPGVAISTKYAFLLISIFSILLLSWFHPTRRYLMNQISRDLIGMFKTNAGSLTI